MSNKIFGLFDSSDIESVTTLIIKLEESSFDYLKLEGDGVKVVIGKNGICEDSEANQVSVEIPKQEIKADPKPEGHVDSQVVNSSVIEEEVAPLNPAGSVLEVKEEEGISVVKSPSWGLFYAQPEPAAPAYVKLGDSVKKGDTLGLVEIMKTYTAIVADTDGEIIAIHVDNEQQLEPEQPLFSIKKI